MGGGIAYQTAYKGVPIVIKDIRQDAVDLGLGEASKLLAKRVERGQLKPAQMGEMLTRINPTLDYADVRDADIVIEAVVENEGIKKSVLKELESTVSEDAIIATNTSTISIDTLASALTNKKRFCGMHFFNPVHVMPLVEVIRGKDTSEETVATTVEFASKIGKNPIVVNDCPGFLVNRVLFPYLNAFELLVRDGAGHYPGRYGNGAFRLAHGPRLSAGCCRYRYSTSRCCGAGGSLPRSHAARIQDKRHTDV